MNSPNEDREQSDNMKLLKQQASGCAPGCDCHASAPGSRRRLILGAIVLLVTVTLVVRAVIKTHGAQDQPDTAAFALPTAQTPSTEGVFTTLPVETARVPEPSVDQEIGSLAELNTVAAANDGVFVYIPGKDGSSGNPPATAMQNAASRIGSQGYKIGLFKLKAGTRDYDLLAAQMSVPGVLAAFKGRGMSVASGDMTEAKLIQAFVAASNAGACGAGGCGPSGCK